MNTLNISEQLSSSAPYKLVILLASQGENKKLAESIRRISLNIFQHCDIIDAIDLNLPIYNDVLYKSGEPAIIKKVVQNLNAAHAIAVASPEYNGGIPPSLVNTIAWISRHTAQDWRQAFKGKPTVITSYSSGGGARVLAALRLQLSYIGCHVLAREISVTRESALEDALQNVLNECYRLCLGQYHPSYQS